MIGRDDVLHVARLARLDLSEEEVEQMRRDLTRVLDYVDKISELDLVDVPPMTSVAQTENALRADEPIVCLPRDVVLAAAPEVLCGGFGVPSPQARAS